MQQRTRDVSDFTELGHHEFGSFNEFELDRKIRPGLTSILTNDRWFDFFYEDRGSDTTLIAFTAAIPDHFPNYPAFSSRPIAETLGVNYLGFADPAQGGPESLTTFWHLSTERVDTVRIVPAIIEDLSEQQPGQRLLFFGSSAGGFAALNYGALFPGSSVFVMNPRINVMNTPKHFKLYAPIAHPNGNRVKVANSLPVNVAKVYEQPRGNHVLYLQNVQDPNYYRHHYLHFKQAVVGRDDVRFVLGEWGKGHVVPPRDVYVTELRKLARVDV